MTYLGLLGMNSDTVRRIGEKESKKLRSDNEQNELKFMADSKGLNSAKRVKFFLVFTQTNINP